MEPLSCLFCARRNPGDAKFCNECGTPLDLKPCRYCEGVNARSAERCYRCDAALPVDAPLPLDAAPPVDAARVETELPSLAEVEARPIGDLRDVVAQAGSALAARRFGPGGVASNTAAFADDRDVALREDASGAARGPAPSPLEAEREAGDVAVTLHDGRDDAIARPAREEVPWGDDDGVRWHVGDASLAGVEPRAAPVAAYEPRRSRAIAAGALAIVVVAAAAVYFAQQPQALDRAIAAARTASAQVLRVLPVPRDNAAVTSSAPAASPDESSLPATGSAGAVNASSPPSREADWPTASAQPAGESNDIGHAGAPSTAEGQASAPSMDAATAAEAAAAQHAGADAAIDATTNSGPGEPAVAATPADAAAQDEQAVTAAPAGRSARGEAATAPPPIASPAHVEPAKPAAAPSSRTASTSRSGRSSSRDTRRDAARSTVPVPSRSQGGDAARGTTPAPSRSQGGEPRAPCAPAVAALGLC